MIRIVRLKYKGADAPAGEIFDFHSVKDAVTFMWGRDFTEYLIVKDGHELNFENEDLEVSNVIKKMGGEE